MRLRNFISSTFSKKLTGLFALSLLTLSGCDQFEVPGGGNGGSTQVDGNSSTGQDPNGDTAAGKACGGNSGVLSCKSTQFCKYPESAQCGAGDAQGACTLRPERCTEIFAPVCGCDGKTYSNDCKADAAGVSIVHQGACKDAGKTPGKEGQACGGLSGLTCDANLYCNYPESAQCGAADALGVCSARPDGCTKEYMPVCGCDGKTYGNACTAAAAGVSVSYKGECKASGNEGQACGGSDSLTCSDGLFCKYPESAQCGAGDALGACTSRPTQCAEIWAPVCGCDGKTYGNACGADEAGISIQYKGRCKQSGDEGQSCGGLTGASCKDGLFCKFSPKDQCGAADATGTCSERPTQCIEIYAPVCGCDGKTYSNDCKADEAGVSILHEGQCKPDNAGKPGAACGGSAGLGCNSGLFCSYPIAAQCGNTGDQGACAERPEMCPDIYKPVCGCDGKTYSNQCYASMSGVSVASDGECQASPGKKGDKCGSRGMSLCEKDLFCRFEVKDQCGAADVPGTCDTRPEACIEIFDPVCGCDGKTYGNDCKAHAAGVSISKVGAC